jgi:hypothetical protein
MPIPPHMKYKRLKCEAEKDSERIEIAFKRSCCSDITRVDKLSFSASIGSHGPGRPVWSYIFRCPVFEDPVLGEECYEVILIEFDDRLCKTREGLLKMENYGKAFELFRELVKQYDLKYGNPAGHS